MCELLGVQSALIIGIERCLSSLFLDGDTQLQSMSVKKGFPGDSAHLLSFFIAEVFAADHGEVTLLKHRRNLCLFDLHNFLQERRCLQERKKWCNKAMKKQKQL